MQERATLRIAKLVAFSLVIILLAGLLFVIADRPFIVLRPFDNEIANGMLSYQVSALPVAGLALLVTWVFAGRVRLRYLNPRRTGEMRPLLGSSAGGRWESDGWVLGLIMVGIVAAVTFFQFQPGGFTFHWAAIVLAVPLAAMNAFTEESVFRLPFVTMGDNDTGSRTYGLVMSAIVFGGFHYWGVAPNGILGVVMSTFLGFILAKSMQETRGFFWAFMIHFALDVPILIFVLNQTPGG
ncbi:CPBP family intramembrane glutamic endopeptidase [Microbacterium aurantiacum]|uniref:CPBP family intramembrane metalloprotease n=1 Tax=Microbacterium aurantiacum TaxID=162393 RepID=A0ABT8FVN9_9MICO|nr:CPBP family intramembrane glutamic endopeptidase [Microbacterium aurantiacum]MBN9201239.1 CPBP family intramembrane metalloprotease [Microbacterium chocolatum]MDN4465290.1 CPBP family intramembrane metalloprotease [Microbacterium aurantiacum]